MPLRSRFRASGHAIIATLRLQDSPQATADRCMPAEDASQREARRRLRAAGLATIAVSRLRTRARERQSSQQVSVQRRPSWHGTYTLHRFRSYVYVLLFISFVLHQRLRKCSPLDKALQIISDGRNFKLDQALNAGKCKVLVELFSSIGNRLRVLQFLLQNLKSPLKADAYKHLSACYYTLKDLCRLLLMSTQYIQDCTGYLPSRQVFAKLEKTNTIKFLLLEVYRSYQLVTIRFEGFLSSIADASLQEFSWHCQPPNSPGLCMGQYLQLQAEKDLNHVLDDLRQHPRLNWSGFMRNRKSTLNAAEDEALRGLLLARLINHPKEELGNLEFLKKGLFVEKNYVRFVKLIGFGSYGKVDEVVCFGEKYAMKTIAGISAIEDANEAVIQARLHHPNIVKLVWYTCNFDSQDSLSLLMDLMSSNLEEFIKQQAPNLKGLSGSCPLVAVDIMMQITRAMSYLHSQNIMYRDLKAANVLVDHSMNPDAFREGYVHVKVADFGLAKVKKVGSQVMNTWKVGTKYWRAPEVFWQEPSSGSMDDLTGASTIDDQGFSNRPANYSFPADVYSFAMTCYEIVTGKTPFHDDLVTSGLHDRILKEKIVKSHKRPSLPVDLYPQLKGLIEECWDGRPENRPSFEAIYDRLDQIKDELMFGSSARSQLHS